MKRVGRGRNLRAILTIVLSALLCMSSISATYVTAYANEIASEITSVDETDPNSVEMDVSDNVVGEISEIEVPADVQIETVPDMMASPASESSEIIMDQNTESLDAEAEEAEIGIDNTSVEVINNGLDEVVSEPAVIDFEELPGEVVGNDAAVSMDDNSWSEKNGEGSAEEPIEEQEVLDVTPDALPEVIDNASETYEDQNALYDDIIANISDYLEIEEKIINLDIGMQIQLNASWNTDNSELPQLIWSSEDESIATVNSEGIVTANSEGVVYVWVGVENQPNVAYCEIDVKAKEDPSDMQSTISDGSTANISEYLGIEEKIVKLNVGTQTQLNVIWNAEDTELPQLVWSSEDESIATVNNEGIVTANGEGVVYIWVGVENQPNVACCEINVEEAEKSITIEYKVMEGQEEFGTVSIEKEEASSFDEIVGAEAIPNDGFVFLEWIDNEGTSCGSNSYLVPDNEGVYYARFGTNSEEELLFAQASTPPLKPLPSDMSGTIRDRVVKLAQSQVGYKEGYSNGEYNNMNAFAVEIGGANGYAWCAYFAAWCLKKAGFDMSKYAPSSCYGSSNAIVSWAQDGGTSGVWHNLTSRAWSYGSAYGISVSTRTVEELGTSFVPRAGDIAIADTDGFKSASPDHTALIVGYDGTYIYTIEGNDSNIVKEEKYVKNGNIGWRRVGSSSVNIVGIVELDFGDTVSPTQYCDGFFESVQGGEGYITVKGWAYDPDYPSQSIACHVYVGGQSDSGVTRYEIYAVQDSPDINSKLGISGKHRFNQTIYVGERGTLPVYIYAIDPKDYHQNKVLDGSSQTVTITNKNTDICKGYLDSVEGGEGCITVDGWAFDNDSKGTSLKIHVYIGPNGEEGWEIIANTSRPDVNKAFPGVGNNHGFNSVINTGKRGSQKVQVFAVDANDSSKQMLIGTKTVTINNRPFAINFPTSTLEVKVGETKKISFTFQGDGINVPNYQMSNSSVASVAWGDIDWSKPQVPTSLSFTGKTTGTSTCTVNLLDDMSKTLYSKSITIKVIQAVTGVSLNKSSTTINVGATETLRATITPTNASNKNANWTSSNTSIATVNASGVVTAKAAGTAIITATAADGSGKKATCTVTVKQLVTNVALNKTGTTINAGATETLTATITPSNASNKAVNWSSSNTSVATVNANGVVTAKAAGTTTITATAADGSGKKETCTVTVKPNVIAVTNVALNKTSTTINVGKTEKLTVTVTPSNASNKTVNWSSNNTSIATVNTSGVITAKAPGTATITATAADGSGKRGTCTVTVKQLVTGISLNRTKTTIVVGMNETLKVTVTPSNASNKTVTWKSNKTSVATVNSSGKVTAKAVGTANITVTANDGSGKSATCIVTVTKQQDPNPGIQTIEMYRLYNRNSGEHLYSYDANERDTLVRRGNWNYEGIAWYAPVSSPYPVYRMYNAKSKAHHYTMDENERDTLCGLGKYYGRGKGWTYEGIGWYSAQSKDSIWRLSADEQAKYVPLHRLYNPRYPMVSAHHYTADEHEVSVLLTRGWVYEGIAWYGIKRDSFVITPY